MTSCPNVDLVQVVVFALLSLGLVPVGFRMGRWYEQIVRRVEPH